MSGMEDAAKKFFTNVPDISKINTDNDEAKLDNYVIELSPNSLTPYPDPKIRMSIYPESKMKELKESIKRSGQLEPAIVSRRRDGTDVLLAGHHRAEVVAELGIDLKCLIKHDLTEDEEKLIAIDTNLVKRDIEEMASSELGYALFTKNEILKKRGAKTDKIGSGTESPVGTKSIAKHLGSEFEISRTEVFRYMRLVNLNESFAYLTDSKKLKLRTAVEISYLKPEEQDQLANMCINDGKKITTKVAEELKRLSTNSETPIDIEIALAQIENKQADPTDGIIKLTTKDINEIVSMIEIKDRKNVKYIIMKALEQYYSN